MSNSFEGGTRWTSHFAMPTLLCVDIICVKPSPVKGLAVLLLAHLACIQSTFSQVRDLVWLCVSCGVVHPARCLGVISCGLV